MSNLLENILSGNLTEANELFESRIDEIMECKLYEEKRRVAAELDEVFGGLSPEQIEMRKKAGYRKAADVLGDPRDKDKKSDLKKKLEKLEKAKEKKIAEESLDEAGLGYGAKVAHDPYMTPQRRKIFMAARKIDKTARAKSKAAKLAATKEPKDTAEPETKDAYKKPSFGSAFNKAAKQQVRGVIRRIATDIISVE